MDKETQGGSDMDNLTTSGTEHRGASYAPYDPESTARLAQIKAQDGLQNRALSFSMILTSSLLVCFLVASFIRVPLVLPDWLLNIIYISIAAPWVGVGGGKIADVFAARLEARK
jgi:hypothetical protein